VSLVIRPADLALEAALLIAYATALFAISFAEQGRFANQFGEDGSGYIAWIAEKQALSPGNAALALLDGEPAGMVVIGPWPDDPAIGYVFHYYLEPHVRGSGQGRALDAYACSALHRHGYREARLSVARTNGNALRFYRKQGWELAGPRPDQPGILYLRRPLRETGT